MKRRKFITLLGGATAAWPLAARAQHVAVLRADPEQLDIVLIHVNKERHSSRLYQPEYPIAFERKIKLAKRWFNQHPPLRCYRKDIRLFTSNIKQIAPIRNYLLHSILQDWDADKQVATMQTIKFEGKDTFRVQKRGVHLRTIKTFGNVANSANKFLSHVTRKVLTDDALRI